MFAAGSSSTNAQLQQEGVHIGAWEEVHLMAAGKWDLKGTAVFPETVRLLKESGVEMVNARLSVLRGPTHITPHCGMSNAKLRIHIGLRVLRIAIEMPTV